MEALSISNPFPGAGAFLVRETGSTMDEAKRLARLGFPAGTVVVADFQSSGRGRVPGRTWESAPGDSLLATVVLGPEAAALPGFPLRVGLALARAAALYAIEGGSSCEEPPAIKWPNDILVGGRKLAGVLCEASEGRTFAGFGVNLRQRSFGGELEGRATSLALVTGLGGEGPLGRERLLELVLANLALALGERDWRSEVESRLWMRGEELEFFAGGADSARRLVGRILGIDEAGSLLLALPGRASPEAFSAGELRLPRTGREPGKAGQS